MLKVRAGRRLKAISTRVLCGTREQMTAALQTIGLSGVINTAFVERLNLTLRELLAPLSRRTWSLAHSEAGLWLHLEWGRSYYHFARVHESLRTPTSRPGRFWSRTPAMAAGVVPKRWSVQEIILLPLQPLEGI